MVVDGSAGDSDGLLGHKGVTVVQVWAPSEVAQEWSVVARELVWMEVVKW